MAANVERLKEYRSKLIIFPRRVGQHKKGDSSKDEVAAVKSAEAASVKSLFEIQGVDKSVQERAIKEDEKEPSAYRKLRIARSDAKYVGAREKRAKAKADAEEAKKK